MNQEYLSIEDAKKLANYDRVVAERDTLKVDNNLLKESISKKDNNYMATLNAKNKKIKELESQLSAYESKQVDMFEV